MILGWMAETEAAKPRATTLIFNDILALLYRLYTSPATGFIPAAEALRRWFINRLLALRRRLPARRYSV